MQRAGPNDFTIYSISEKAVSVAFGNAIDEQILQRISNFNQALQQKPLPGMYSTVPAYTTLSVFFDPLQVIQADGLFGTTCFERVSGYLKQMENTDNVQAIESDVITIPVCYGGEFGPDLEEVAALHHLSTDKIVELHTSAIYTVYMIGFVPGFAYLGGMPEVLASPRKATPRKAIPAGSVGIAGKQTGIYPLITPGGWQIIGQTPLKLFNADREQPALLKAGDKVKFEPVSLADFKTYQGS